MEEEDESRGKTEESGEDRGDGPPDRDPALSPSAFILVRQLGAVRSGGSRFSCSEERAEASGPGPGPQEELGLCVDSGCRVPGIRFSNSRSYRGLGPDFCFFSPFHSGPFSRLWEVPCRETCLMIKV